MKVIDLLNKIANKEKLPKIVKYDDYLLTYDEDTQDYYNEPSCTYSLLNDFHYTDFLNDEVEIIEDTPKKIEKIQLTNGGLTFNTKIAGIEQNYTLTTVERELVYKLNEIIEKVNGE